VKFTQRIMLMPLLSAVAFLVIFMVVFRSVQESSRLVRRLQIDFYASLELTHELEKTLASIRYALGEAVTVGDVDRLEETDALADRFRELVERGEAIPTLAAAEMENLERNFEQYYALDRRLALVMMDQQQIADMGADAGFWRDVEQTNRTYDGLQATLGSLADQQEEKMTGAFAAATGRFRSMNRLATVMALASVALLVVMALGATVSVVRPLRKLRLAAGAIARGDLEQSIDYRSRDDLGQLAESFREMQRALSGEFARREEAEVALRESQQRLSLALDAANDGIWDIDHPRGTFYCSDRFAEILGYDPSEKPTRVEEMLEMFEVAPDSRNRPEDFGTTQGEVTLEGRMRRKDGSQAWVEVKGKTVAHDADGRPVRTVGTVRDVTARKEAELALQRTQQQLVEAAHSAGMAEIATSVLHNVGNVLNTAATSTSVMRKTLDHSRLATLQRLADLLAERARDPAALARWLAEDPQGRELPRFLGEIAGVLGRESGRLREEAEQVAGNIDHIKEIIAVQQGYAGVSGVRERVAPRALVEDAVQLFGTSFERHHIAFRIEQRGAVPPLLVEKHRALQILINLLKNARDAVRDRGGEERRIDVEIRRSDDGRVAIAVRDNGVGIAPDDLARVFGYGFTTKPDGHGFGLHGSANNAKEMGGALTVSSEGPGRGAVFTLVLPTPESEGTG